jgi:cyclopropane fatty-acyl-phospholipid synthase-like methyltransferase
MEMSRREVRADAKRVGSPEHASTPAALTRRIRRHYDLLAPFYAALWGRHVHHGYWESAADPATPSAAQERLIDELYALAGRPRRPRVLDVGCGHAGSLLWLARHAGAHGVGLTISPVQRLAGRAAICLAGQGERLGVRLADAQQPWPVDSRSFDLVWCVECSEHLADRGRLAREAARVLRPGGVLCIAAWLRGTLDSAEARHLRERVERGMLIHPLEPAASYRRHAAAAGFAAVEVRPITPHVERTWAVAAGRAQHPTLMALAWLMGADTRAFVGSFAAMRQAYRVGAMEYGLLVARLRAT